VEGVEDRYGAETFVGLEAGPNGEFEASIQVNPKTLPMFYEHPLVNLRQGGIFLSGDRVLPLGTRLMVTLDFDDPPRTLVVRGYVTYECAQGRGPMGFGVILSGMGREERKFVEEYVARKRGEASPSRARA
jgi:Tfp pilus assembly protein PilZ